MPLREYQRDCLKAILLGYKAGKNRQLVVLPTGCHAIDTPILMYDGSIKKVQDIVPGDTLMGPDGKRRTVGNLCRGSSNMVKIIPTKGDSFIVNEDHILTLIRTNDKETKKNGKITDVSVKDYLAWPKYRKHTHKLFREPVFEFGYKSKLPIKPYWLGMLLGDGTLGPALRITTNDIEIMREAEKMREAYGLRLDFQISGGGAASPIFAGKGKGVTHPLLADLRNLGLFKKKAHNKFIPEQYKRSSQKSRLEILAGLIDTDGHLCRSGSYDFISKSKQLAEDVCFIARSVGLAAYANACNKYSQLGGGGEYHRVSISGHINIIPCRVAHKKSSPRKQKKDVLRTGFQVENLGLGDYYGFSLIEEPHYLMGDFTVTHNTGKGSILAHIPKLFKNKLAGKKMLVIVHRLELVEDLANRLRRYNPELRVEIEQAEQVASSLADVIVASVPTLGRAAVNKSQVETKQEALFDDDLTFVDPEIAAKWSQRLQRLKSEDFPVIVVDEAHHMHGQTYQNILTYFECYKGDQMFDNPDKLLIGVTATPGRADNKGLEVFFDEIAYTRDILWFIQQGYLANIEPYKVTTTVDINDVGTSKGDFNVRELERKVNTPERNKLIVDKYLELGKGLPALAFCVDVQHGFDLAEEFVKQGISAAALNYKTPKEERRETIERFKRGEIRVLCSATLLTEGFDSPNATVALLARPTKSETLYRQSLGRVLRPYPAPEEVAALRAEGKEPEWIKEAAIAIDFVDVSSRHKLNTVPSLFGLTAKFDARGKKITEIDEEVRRAKEKAPMLDLGKAESMGDLQSMVEKIDLFAKPEVPEIAKQNSRLAWMQTPSGTLELSLPDFKTYQIAEDTLGRIRVFKVLKGIRTEISDASARLTMQQAFRLAEAQLLPAERTVANMDAEWRTGAPSDKQIKTFGMLYPEERRQFPKPEDFAAFVRSRWTKGDVSTMIAARIGNRPRNVQAAIIRSKKDAQKRG